MCHQGFPQVTHSSAGVAEGRGEGGGTGGGGCGRAKLFSSGATRAGTGCFVHSRCRINICGVDEGMAGGKQEGRSARGRTFLGGSHSCVLAVGSVDSVVVGSVTEAQESGHWTGLGPEQSPVSLPTSPSPTWRSQNSETRDGPLWLWQVPGQSDFLCPRKAAFLLPNEPGEGLPAWGNLRLLMVWRRSRQRCVCPGRLSLECFTAGANHRWPPHWVAYFPHWVSAIDPDSCCK